MIDAEIISFVLDKVKILRILQTTSFKLAYEYTLHTRSNDMSAYELQIIATSKYYDDAIRAAEKENIEILRSVVPGSRLHEVIHNPIDSGIDEG